MRRRTVAKSMLFGKYNINVPKLPIYAHQDGPDFPDSLARVMSIAALPEELLLPISTLSLDQPQQKQRYGTTKALLAGSSTY